jgi:sorbitol-specific phosphotransferase system component IIBC
MAIVMLSVLLLIVSPALLYGLGWAVNTYVQAPRIPRRLAVASGRPAPLTAGVPAVLPAE